MATTALYQKALLPATHHAHATRRSTVAASRLVAARSTITPRCVAAPMQPTTVTGAPVMPTIPASSPAPLISREAVQHLEAQLDAGAAIAALRRFNTALQALDATNWEPRVRAVMHELAYNLESFNPAFTAVLLKVQRTIGVSDYVGRDIALKHLIQPLAGEYGMHNNEPQARTHRELFSMFYQDLLRAPLEEALAVNAQPPAAVAMFASMMRDIESAGGRVDCIDQACYALGYNLAIEYLADYEKTWMLDSFRVLDAKVLQPKGRGLSEWLFLEVHAEGEAEHAVIGHNAVLAFVPECKVDVLRAAMRDHDRDMARFYNTLADMLEGQ